MVNSPVLFNLLDFADVNLLLEVVQLICHFIWLFLKLRT